MFSLFIEKYVDENIKQTKQSMHYSIIHITQKNHPTITLYIELSGYQ